MNRVEKNEVLSEIFNIFKKRIKLKHKIIFQIEKLDGDDGECYLNENDEIVISVNKSNNIQNQAETIVHEYAHAILIDKNDSRIEHSKKWGVAYSKVWRTYEKYYLLS